MNKETELIIAAWGCLILAHIAGYAGDVWFALLWGILCVVNFVCSIISNRLRRMREAWAMQKMRDFLKERVAGDAKND